MTSIDDKIKEALNDEYNEIVNKNSEFDASLVKQFSSGFKGKMKKGYRIIYSIVILFYTIASYCAYKFYFAHETKQLIAFAAIGLFFVIGAMLGELWYISEMGRKRVISEIKVVELQLAQVLKNQEKE
jgi:hypothetical protein